jgi:hypothetical protein
LNKGIIFLLVILLAGFVIADIVDVEAPLPPDITGKEPTDKFEIIKVNGEEWPGGDEGNFVFPKTTKEIVVEFENLGERGFVVNLFSEETGILPEINYFMDVMPDNPIISGKVLTLTEIVDSHYPDFEERTIEEYATVASPFELVLIPAAFEDDGTVKEFFENETKAIFVEFEAEKPVEPGETILEALAKISKEFKEDVFK